MPNKVKDLTGQRFGQLVVLERAANIGGRAAWLCQCDCGGQKIVRSSNLQKGNTQSCGCKKIKQLQELHDNNVIDIMGQKFNKLTVIERISSDNNGNSTWLCRCDCGGSKVVASNHLRNGLVQSCGCLKSKNEARIAELLSQNNIPFIKEHIINDPHTQEQYRFDFYINNQYYLEYDGEQHFKVGTGWSTKEKLEYTHIKDIHKNNYCFEYNIPLIRIPYEAEYIFEDLLLPSSRFILTKENSKKYYEKLLTNDEECDII